MGRPQVLSPIPHNLPEQRIQRRDLSSKEAIEVTGSMNGKKRGDEAGAAAGRKGLMARYRSGARADRRASGDGARRQHMVRDASSHSTMNSAESSHSAERRRSAAVSNAAEHTAPDVMPKLTRSASRGGAAAVRPSNGSIAGRTRTRQKSIDSSHSSASHSSKISSADGDVVRDFGGPSQHRQPANDSHLMRTPTLHRHATYPQPRAQALQGQSRDREQNGRQEGADILEESDGPDRLQLADEATPRRRNARQAIVEIFSPMRAMRVARAGMKRKHGDGARRPQASRHQSDVTFASASASTFEGSAVNGLDASEGEGAVRPQLPRKTSREVSSAHLRRNMRAMRLSDRDEPAGNAPRRASGRSTRTSSRTSSYQRQVSAGSSSQKAPVSREEARDAEALIEYDEAFKDVDESEIQRLLTAAPSWQLGRLSKMQLQTLHLRLGTWQAFDAVDLDVFTKQDLVDGIIKSRSVEVKPATPSSALSSFAGRSGNTSLQSRRRSSGNMSHSFTTMTSLTSQSSGFTDDSEDEEQSHGKFENETDANDAAGEETEVEPAATRARKGAGSVSSTTSPILHRLRHAHSRYKLHGNSGYSSSSAAASGSRLAPPVPTAHVAMSPAKRRLRHQASVVFAAASPARQRSRAHDQSSSSSRRTSMSSSRVPQFQQRTLRANANGELAIHEAPPQPRRRQQRKKLAGANASTQRGSRANFFARRSDVAKTNGAGRPVDGESSDEEDWEDDSAPSSLRAVQGAMRAPPRQAKQRAKQYISHGLSGAEDSEALVEEALGDRARRDDSMSIGESTEGEDGRPPLSDMSLDSSEDTFIAGRGGFRGNLEDEDDQSDESDAEEPSENEVQASPSKVRRLRNGKMRYPTTPTAEKGEAAAQLVKDLNDVDMNAEDGASLEMSASLLGRLKRDRLVALCEERQIEYAPDATRAVLIDALLAHQDNPPDSTRTSRPQDSARTARPGSKSGSDRPLLLRSGSMPRQSDKPGTPVPSQQGEEELNGLDLESLDLVDKEIPFSKLEKLEKIGSGGFKDVYVGKYQISKKTSKKVAICDIRDQLSEMDIKELTLLRDLKHENIVRFIGVSIPPPEMRLTPCMIVAELCSNGDLYDYIRNTEPPPDQDIFRILLEIARGLEYLHTRTPAIIHRDCKSTNVLVTRNKTAKINDFGLARVRNNKRAMIKSLVGTVNWQAVELWQPKPSYNEKVDVWSAAMTFWETLQWHQPEKKYPFQDMNEHQIYHDVGQKKLRPPTISVRRRYGPEIVDLLDRMWDHSAKERPTMTEVCNELEALVTMKRDAAAVADACAAVDASGRRLSTTVNGTTRKVSR